MKRPLDLHLVPNEIYPGTREINDEIKNPTIITDLTQMSQFVHAFYIEKVQYLKNAMVI